MKKIIHLALLNFISVFVMAQSNYKPGYVVNIKGDTVRGFIDYRGWDSNPISIYFKNTVSDAERKKFTTNDINYFNILGIESYRKYTVPVSTDITSTANTTQTIGVRDTSFEIETVFLKELQNGKNLVLYKLTDDLKTRFYLGEAPDFSPKELVYRVYQYASDLNFTYEKGYLKLLFALADKYRVLDKDLAITFQKAEYTTDDLLVIVSKINGISKAEFKKKFTGHAKPAFMVSAALNISTTSSLSESSYTEGGGGPYTSFLPAVSFGLNWALNPNSDKIDLRAEVLFAETKFNKTYLLLVDPHVQEKATFNQTGISFIPQIIYNFYHAENLKIYLDLGFYITSSSFSDVFFGSNNPNISDAGFGASNPYYFNKVTTGVILKAGVNFTKKWEVFLSYLPAIPSTDGRYFAFNNSSTRIGVAYFWGE